MLHLGIDRLLTQTAAERHLEGFVLKVNADDLTLAGSELKFGAILDRFSEDERMMETKQSRPGKTPRAGSSRGSGAAGLYPSSRRLPCDAACPGLDHDERVRKRLHEGQT